MHYRRALMSILPTLAFLASAEARAQSAHSHHDEGMAVHGMVLFGDGALHASHIPMFAPPHAWQALFEVELHHSRADAQAVYAATHSQGAQQLVTLKPKPFSLPQLLQGQVASFTADMYLGNFEEGGPLLLENVTVLVNKVALATPLRADSAPLPKLTYFTEGEGNSTFLVHKISSGDNFDHIVEVRWSTPAPGVAGEIVFPELGDSPELRLKAGQSFRVKNLAGTWTATSSSQDATADTPTFTVVSDFYCTPGPEFFGTCP